MNDITWIVFPSLQIKMNTKIYHLLLIMLNPLTPKSDKHLISPFNITPESHIKVRRMKGMITRLLIVKQILFLSTLGKV